MKQRLKPLLRHTCRWILAALAVSLCASAPAQHLKFDFGNGKPQTGRVRVSTNDFYSPEKGYGFEAGSAGHSLENSDNAPSCVTSDQPFSYSVKLAEGNYRVKLMLGNPAGTSTNTIKCELRRLMLENVRTSSGILSTQLFIANIRTPEIPGGDRVRLKERERTLETRAWDEKLTIEFNGSRPAVCAVEIEPAPEVPTVFLLGDSTVCDQPSEPWNSWGQMLPRFFKPTVAVANHAQSGETLRSSLGARRLDKVLSAMRPGDYLFIQFGHNDMKDRATNAVAQYKSNLERFVARARDKGGIPVLITSMERKAGVDRNTLQVYPATVRLVAKEANVPLIDLHALSQTLYQALGADLAKAFHDGTHHNNYGSYELAQCVAQSIKTLQLPLAKELVDGFSFNPARPDPVDQFHIPLSPGPDGLRPLGD